MVKGFKQIAMLTTFSRILGMLRDMAFAYFLGAGGFMDGWVIAFKIPNLARRIFGEGAAASSLVPVYSEELERNPKQADKLASSVVTVIFLVLLAIVLIGTAFIWLYSHFFAPFESTKLMLRLMSIMLPYMILICCVAILAGVLNSHRHFAAPALAPIILNIFIISSLCLAGWFLKMKPERIVYMTACAVLTAGLCQIGVQFIPLKKLGVSIRPALDLRNPAFRKIMILIGPMILGLTVTQINTLADDLIAKWLSGSLEKGESFTVLSRQIRYPVWEGAVSHLFYSQRLYQMPLGVLGISLATAIFPVMSTDAARKDFKALINTISLGLKGAVYIAFPATVGLILIRKPLVSTLFERGEFDVTDSLATAHVLLFYSIGLWGFFSQQIVTRAFYAEKDSKSPAITAILAVILNVILNLTLIWVMKEAGLALSTALCSYFQVIILLIILKRRHGGHLFTGYLKEMIKILIATVFMGLIATLTLKMMAFLPEKILIDTFKTSLSLPIGLIQILVIVPLCILIYYSASRLMRIEMLSLVIHKKVPGKELGNVD